MKIPETNIELKENCIYCEKGKYEIYAHPSNDPQMNFKVKELADLSIPSHNNWIILICNSCGNIQFFRPDLSK